MLKSQNISISDDEIRVLVTSALTALKQKEEIDYIVHSNNNYAKNLSIKIIDHKNTGQVQEGMRWSHGIHEFLEVKHGIELDKETMTPISLSHVIFYDRYQKIFGFSGTLGSSFEREHIKTIYNLDMFDIPSYRPSLRVDFPTKTFSSISKMRESLIEKVEAMQKEGRPVLILCLSIKETGEIGQLFQNRQISHQLYNEMQEDSAETVIGRAGDPGVITVSTNNAGRGTDIILSEESVDNGGLHVIFTYYPTSKRVEDQGIGRAGRQGQKGSSEILAVTDMQTKDLALSRLKQEGTYSEMLTRRAYFERQIHHYVDKFWDSIGNWKEQIKNGSYIESAIKTLSPMDKNLAINAVLGSNKKVASFDFIIEELISKVEGEVFQRWSETFFEPSERLMIEAQSSGESKKSFNESLALLFKKSQSSWMPFILEDGSGCGLWLNLRTPHIQLEEERKERR